MATFANADKCWDHIFTLHHVDHIALLVTPESKPHSFDISLFSFLAVPLSRAVLLHYNNYVTQQSFWRKDYSIMFSLSGSIAIQTLNIAA